MEWFSLVRKGNAMELRLKRAILDKLCYMSYLKGRTSIIFLTAVYIR